MLATWFLPEDLKWLECILRILLATALGFALGVERQLRLKVAGIRTHVVVAAGAALFTIVSFGFGEFLGGDSARIAAQVVTGIGFLGAGMIMHKETAVLGLTSAAGIWLTAAIAMAAGAGMYYVAIGATVLSVLIQLFLHLPLRLFQDRHYNEIKITFKSDTDDCLTIIKKLFDIKNFTEFKAVRVEEEIVYHAVIHTRMQVDAAFIFKALQEYPFVVSLEKTESDR